MVPKAAAKQAIELPVTVTEPADVARLIREMENLENYLFQAAKRQAGEAKLPKTSRPLDDLARLNKLDLLAPAQRKRLMEFLDMVRLKAPVLHISFSVDASSAFIAKLVTWLRQNISAITLVQIGRQPTLGGGCVLRAGGKQYDFSFRQYMQAKRGALSGILAEANKP